MDLVNRAGIENHVADILFCLTTLGTDNTPQQDGIPELTIADVGTFKWSGEESNSISTYSILEKCDKVSLQSSTTIWTMI